MSHHILPDIVATGIRLLIVGEQAGPESARVGHYYAGPRNRFWSALAQVGLTPRELSCTEDVKLLDFGIGLTDLKKRTVHGDASPPTGEDRARLLQLVDEWKPQIVAFHGAEIARQFFNSYKISCGELRRYDIQEPLKGCEMFVVTSASAANGHYKKQLWSWHDLAKKLRP